MSSSQTTGFSPSAPAAPSPSPRLARWQDRLNRPWRAFNVGCNCNRVNLHYGYMQSPNIPRTLREARYDQPDYRGQERMGFLLT